MLFKFNLNGMLIGFEINATLSDGQYDYFFKNLPMKVEILTVSWKKNSNTLKISEVPLDLSFDAFWTKYAYKVGDKKKAEKLWSKLNDADRSLALNNIDKYSRFAFERNIDKVYPERYLSQERFKNEFK